MGCSAWLATVFKGCQSVRSLNESSGFTVKVHISMARFYEQLAAALAENQPFALALISGIKGSSPQRIGAKALFFPGRQNRRHARRRLSRSRGPRPRPKSA